jgi:DNA-binding transcriptional regulator YbjK
MQYIALIRSMETKTNEKVEESVLESTLDGITKIEFKQIEDWCIDVTFNQKRIAVIIKDIDGSYYVQFKALGTFSAYVLIDIADKLNELNKLK